MTVKVIQKTISADRFTPLVVFKKLQGLALLESAVLEIGKSRYSIIEVEEAFRLVLQDKGVVLEQGGKTIVLSKDKSEYLKILKAYSKNIQLPDHLDLPIPACGIGYLGYETVRFYDEINFAEQNTELKLPEAVFSFGSVFTIFDHYKDELHVIALAPEKLAAGLEKKVDQIIERLQDHDFRAYNFNEKKYPCKGNLTKDKNDFLEGVKKIKQEIIKGNLLQGVLSRRVRIETELEPLEAYRRLRRENPSPYLFFLNFGDFILLGSSPEIMVQLSGRTAVLKPIAGTRPRGRTVQEDLALEKELLNDEKERAEHLMLLDLGRNDLGRVAKKDTVKVVNSFGVERYSKVMHIVSEIEAELNPPHDVYDLLRATFPAGTVSGAPKIKAIEVLSGLEKNQRGPYAGLIGYFDAKGNFDSCINIRSAVYQKGSYYLQAGAGIVFDSDPEREFQETVYKTQALLKALGVEL